MYSNSLLSTTCRSAGGRSDAHAAHRRQNAVLLIDQDASRTRLLCDILSMSGLRVSTVATTTEAQRALSLENIGAIVAEHKTVGGHAWLDWLATQQCRSRVIYLHEGSELSTAVDLMKRGAHEVFESPWRIGDVVHSVESALEQFEAGEGESGGGMLGALETLYARVAQSDDDQGTIRLILEAAVAHTRADAVSLLVPTAFRDRTICHSGVGVQLTAQDMTRACFGLTDRIIATDNAVFDWIDGAQAHEEIGALAIYPLRVKNQSVGLLVAQCLRTNRLGALDSTFLSVLSERLAVTLASRQQELVSKEIFQHTVDTLLAALSEKDGYTAGHSERVATIAREVAVELGCDDSVVDMVFYGARLHDIGKLSIDDAELNKAGPLTDAEYERMKFHTVSGAELLEAIPCFKPLIPAILGHHERLDGSGYPHGLKGDEIPLLARIVAVADAYDAMTSDRTYRKAMSSIDALSELDRCRDRHYDGACIDALKRAFETKRF